MHTLLQWNPPFGVVEMSIVTSALVLLRIMRCMSFFTAHATLYEQASSRTS